MLVLAAAAQGDTLAEMHKRGTLRWGGDANGGAPYLIDQGPGRAPTGFEAEFAAYLAAKLGLHDQFVQKDWDMLPQDLEARRRGYHPQRLRVVSRPRAGDAFDHPLLHLQVAIGSRPRIRHEGLARPAWQKSRRAQRIGGAPLLENTQGCRRSSPCRRKAPRGS